MLKPAWTKDFCPLIIGEMTGKVSSRGEPYCVTDSVPLSVARPEESPSVHDTAASYKVLLLGLDGATWDLLKPWVDAGYLPNLKRVMSNGAWGPLASTILPQTPPAWTSMVTGVHPGKHGVLGFVKRRPGTYEKEYPTSRDRCRETLWDLIGRAGKRSIIFDLPLSFPPDPVHGVMVAGLGTPGWTSDFVWPRELKETIISRFGPYEFDIYFSGDIRQFLEEAVRMTEHRVAVARYLLHSQPWDFFMMVLTTPDRVQHVAWNLVDERHPDYDAPEAARHHATILEFYRLIDQAVGEFVALVDNQTVVIIASDHGFGPVHTKVALSRWLWSEGLLVLGDQRRSVLPPDELSPDDVRGRGEVALDRGLETLFMLRVHQPDNFAGLVFEVPGLKRTSNYEVKAVVAGATAGAALELNDLARPGGQIIGGGSLSGGPQEVSAVFQPHSDPVRIMVAMTTYGGNRPGEISVKSVSITELEDWTRTRAYTLDVGEAAESRRIRLNLRGREPHGIIEPGAEYERLRESLMARLKDLRDGAGRPVFAGVYRDEEAFPGPCRDDAADVVVVFSPGVAGTRTPGRTEMTGPVVSRSAEGYSGKHERDGVLVVKGPPIKAGVEVGAQIVDVCPTVLHLMDVPVPNDLDGQALWEIFTPTFRAARPAPTAVSVLPGRTPDAGRSGQYTAEERRQVEERLRRLGYID